MNYIMKPLYYMPYTCWIFRTHGPHEYIKPTHTEIYYIYADCVYYLHVGFYTHKHTYRNMHFGHETSPPKKEH